MSIESTKPRLAVLIDADNISPRTVEQLFEEISDFGTPVIRRVYGNILLTGSKAWASVAERFALLSRQQFVSTTGKNATDIALVIDAMDLMVRGQLDGFCIVSSDRDFTMLAIRLREQGLKVYGFGEAKTPDCFKQACDGFLRINPDGPEPLLPVAKPPKTNSALPPAVDAIRRAIEALNPADGWAALSDVGTWLKLNVLGYSAKRYGSSSLSKLAKKTGAFHVETKDGGRLRLLPSTSPPDAQASNNKSTPAKAIAPIAATASI